MLNDCHPRRPLKASPFASRGIVALIALFLTVCGALAQDPLRIGVSLFPPNVSQSEDGQLEGFDIELWREIARDADLQYEFEVLPLADLLAALETGQVDGALAGLSVRAEREARMDFSHPYMLAGLRILTKVDDRSRFARYMQSATNSGATRAFLFLVGFILVCAHVMFLAERGSDSISRHYFPGIFEAAWFVVATMTTVGYGDVTPHRWLGRFVAFVVMVTGIGLFGVLIADLSTGMTLQEVQARISAPSDLAGRTVATVRQSTSVDVARSHGALILERETLDEAVAALIANEADAVVFDGPPLLQYVQRHTDKGLVIAPPSLTVETYAVAFPSDSPIREAVNRSLLELQENGERDRLYEKWFGVGP